MVLIGGRDDDVGRSVVVVLFVAVDLLVLVGSLIRVGFPAVAELGESRWAQVVVVFGHGGQSDS